MSDKYVLDANGEAVPATFEQWANWMETAGDTRRLGNDLIGDVHVSTVFLGLDHSFSDGPPVLWETMIFGGEHDQYQERYTSREDALAGHERAKALVAGGTEAVPS
jgi:hypothetical protein